MANTFRQALEILDTKNGDELTEDEQELVAAAMIPLFLLPQFNDMPVGEGLEELARIVEENVLERMFGGGRRWKHYT